MAALKGNPQLSPADPAFSITSRQTVVLINGVTSINLDMIDPAATFDCEEGDNVLIVNTDVNAVGPSLTSDPFSIVASTGPTVPPKPTVLGVVFTAAP